MHSPLIGVHGVATRRHGPAWARTHAERRSNHVHSALIGGESSRRSAAIGGESGRRATPQGLRRGQLAARITRTIRAITTITPSATVHTRVGSSYQARGGAGRGETGTALTGGGLPTAAP